MALVTCGWIYHSATDDKQRKIMTDISLLNSYSVWAYLLHIQKTFKYIIFLLLLLLFEETLLRQPCLSKCIGCTELSMTQLQRIVNKIFFKIFLILSKKLLLFFNEQLFISSCVIQYHSPIILYILIYINLYSRQELLVHKDA